MEGEAAYAQAGDSGGDVPPPVPATTTVEVAARSVPFDRASAVSGDWNDILPLPSGDIVVIVGDAVGRGRRAASLKTQLQPEGRRMARAGASPAEVVERLHTVAANIGSDSEVFATIVCAVIRPARLELLHANAGHPPPLLVFRNGATRFIDNAVGPPIGAPMPPPHELAARTPIRPGDTLVLYTDGLIEDRHHPIDSGLARVAGTAADMAGGTSRVERLCDGLIELGMCNGRPRDDLTVVAARVGKPSCAPSTARLLARHRDIPTEQRWANADLLLRHALL